MANYMEDDLLGLSASSSNPISPISTPASCSVGKGMATSTRRSTAQSDSFASLAGLMKAKPSYVPIPPPTPRLSLSATSNGMLFASPKLSASSMLSPTAKPYIASAAAWVDEQERAFTTPSSRVPEHEQTDLERLEALTRSINDFPIDDEPDCRPRTPSLPSSPSLCQVLHPAFHSLPRNGPNDPPMTTASIKPPISAHDRANEPIVRVTKTTWDSKNKDLTTLLKEKRSLERQLADLEHDHQALRDEDYDRDVTIGKHRYQHEADRNHKAEMGRSIAHRDVEIKNQQLEIENLGRVIVDLNLEIHRLGKVIGDAEWLRVSHKDSEAAHARDIELKDAALQRQEETIKNLTRECNAAAPAQVHVSDYVTRPQNLADTLSSREKLITELRQSVLEEQIRATELEERVEILQEKADQGVLDNFKEQLREKSTSLDRMRNKCKLAERHLEISQARLEKALGGGEALRGGAHLVAPSEKSKLPKNVISCSECYAKNITCDNKARCQNCVESLTKCARWRCSMKHKLGDCPDAPCQLPHDHQGWLVTMEPRPTW